MIHKLTGSQKISEPEPFFLYQNMALLDLIRCIVYKNDRQALDEFHTNRTLFRYDNSEPLLFINFLNKLRDSTAQSIWRWHNSHAIADIAYDLTLDKFARLPDANSKKSISEKNETNMKRSGTDCRYYFNAFLERMKQLQQNHRGKELEEEYQAAQIMQGLVRRHFYLSVLEASRRTNPFWSRYNWNVNGTNICLWLPKALKGKERRKWLEANIEGPDPAQPHERQRIQAIIDQKMLKEHYVPLSKAEGKIAKETSPFWSDMDENLGISLAQSVADEKVVNIDKQRRKIKALGKEKLKKMILCIFENIVSGEKEDIQLAMSFGLSQATFSRFAGRHWLKADSEVPDLWLNTAEVLSKHNIFKETVIESGFWEQVSNTLKKGNPRT